MSQMQRCPQCQAEIPAGAPEGLCPQCLLQAGLEPKTAQAEPKTAAYAPAGSGFAPPTSAALQAAFPQLEILELLGKGGMGAVYKARQRTLDRFVAVKILPPEFSQDPAFVERFLREAKALAMLSHANIVAIHDVGQAGGYCFFVMEFVDGVNLRQAMHAGNLKAAEALKIVPQICDALQFAHDEGIVHRDIKPENILLDKKGRVKIADFGLAKLLGKTHEVTLTGTQQVMGTLHYMAPEQIEGARDVDHRADIYSLGVTFYEMLTGELPIGRFAAPSKKVEIDVRLDEVVLRSLEKAPEQRYQHASEIKTDVEAINLPASSSGQAPPSTEAKSSNTAELNPVNLLEATSGWKRWLPLVFLAPGLIGLFPLMALGLGRGDPGPGLCVGGSICFGLILLGFVQALTLTTRWNVEYRGHRIAVEFQNASASRRLMIDGLTAATATGATSTSGGNVWDYVLRATIPHGKGIGDEIVCTVERGIILRCRILALPRTPIAAPIHATERYQQASEIKADMETIARGPTAIPEPSSTQPPARTGDLRAVVLPIAVLVSIWCLVMLAFFGVPHLLPPLPARGERSVLWDAVKFLLVVVWFLLPTIALILSGIWLYRRAATVGGYMRSVLVPFVVVSVIWLLVFGLMLGFEASGLVGGLWIGPHELAVWAGTGPVIATLMGWPAIVALILNIIWLSRLYRAATVGGYLRTVVIPFLALSAIWLLLSTGQPPFIPLGPLQGMFLVGLILNGVWLCRTFGIGFVWKYLPYAWTLLCVVLFVMLWTPYDTTRAIWSGYLDGSIWPYHEITDCAVSLEPKEPTCKRIIIREKEETTRSGYEMAHRNALQPGRDRRIRFTYEIELQPLKGEPRHLVVDALNGMSWKADERSGSILDAVSLAEWLQAGDVSELEAPEATQKKRQAALALQARNVVDIIQIASRDPYVFYYWVDGRRQSSRLQNATHGGGAMFRGDTHVTESDQWEPVVPILYVGVPLMLAVWGVGLWLLLRPRRGAPASV